MSNYPFLVTSFFASSKGGFPPTKSRKSSSSWGTQFSKLARSAKRGLHQPNQRRLRVFHFPPLVTCHFWERVYASPIPTGWLHPPFESTDGAHRLVYGLSYWWLIYIDLKLPQKSPKFKEDLAFFIESHLAVDLLIQLIQWSHDLRRHRGYECIQAPYFAGAQLAHFAEQGVVQTIFGPPGLLLYGHSAAHGDEFCGDTGMSTAADDPA